MFPFLAVQPTFNRQAASRVVNIEAADACLEITTPNKMTRWNAGSTQRIEWIATGAANSGNLLLRLPTVGGTELKDPQASNGYFDWAIPTALPADTSYQIRAISYGAPGVVFATPAFEIAVSSDISSSTTSSDIASSTPATEDANQLDPLLFGAIGVASALLIIGLLLCAIIVVFVVVALIAVAAQRSSRTKAQNDLEMQSISASRQLFDPDADAADGEVATRENRPSMFAANLLSV